MLDPEFESVIQRFEQAWRCHGPRSIEEVLGEPFEPGSPGRGRLLIELICVDLEYRWRNPGVGGPASLQAYVERFPDLGSLDRLPIDLIGEAYRVRHRWGDRPSHAEFLSAFRERREEIREELTRVDVEIEEEAEPGDLSRSAGLPEPVPTDIPLISHRDFLLRRLIGAGSTGKVYEARPHAGGGDVAVKFLRKSLLNHADVVRRFLGEAHTVAGLRHPNIVGTRGLGRTDGGSYFLVMELVAGPDLATHAGGRIIAEEEAIAWAMQICDALDHAHGRGVVHCDLKPANILLDERGRIKVTDFGLARSVVGDSAWINAVEGTAPFMAPEQASRSWGRIDHRTDVYGLGAVLFALLTGRPPSMGPSLPDILAQVIAPTPVISPTRLRPDLSEPLTEICRRCLAKAPEARFQDVREARSALRASSAGGRGGGR